MKRKEVVKTYEYQLCYGIDEIVTGKLYKADAVEVVGSAEYKGSKHLLVIKIDRESQQPVHESPFVIPEEFLK